jgi:hypothetical protein
MPTLAKLAIGHTSKVTPQSHFVGMGRTTPAQLQFLEKLRWGRDPKSAERSFGPRTSNKRPYELAILCPIRSRNRRGKRWSAPFYLIGHRP